MTVHELADPNPNPGHPTPFLELIKDDSFAISKPQVDKNWLTTVRYFPDISPEPVRVGRLRHVSDFLRLKCKGADYRRTPSFSSERIRLCCLIVVAMSYDPNTDIIFHRQQTSSRQQLADNRRLLSEHFSGANASRATEKRFDLFALQMQGQFPLIFSGKDPPLLLDRGCDVI